MILALALVLARVGARETAGDETSAERVTAARGGALVVFVSIETD